MQEPEVIPIMTPRLQFPVTIRSAQPLSDEALFEFCRHNRDLRIERTARGELVIMSPTGGETGRRNFVLIGRFSQWVARDGTGIGFDSSTGFLLPNGAERSPDVSWVRRSRWHALTSEQHQRFVPLCPDFVIELRSPTDPLATLQSKMEEYLANGTVLGWLIDPDSRAVWVYEAGKAPERLDGPSALTGEPMLPGLVLDLEGIW